MSIDMTLDKAFSAYNAGELGLAEDLARHALTVSPTHGDALYLLGLIAMRSGASEAASKIMHSVVQAYPNVEGYDLMLASILQKMGHHDEAIAYYKKYPNNIDAIVQTGYIYLEKNQASTALECFNEALKLKADSSTALVGKAVLMRMLHKPYVALLERAVKLSPDDDVHYQLSIAYYDKKQYRKALNHAHVALQFNQADYLYNQEGLCLEQLGKLDEAWNAYKRAIELNPYNASASLNQGNVAAQQKKWTIAEGCYKQAIQHDDRNVEALTRLGFLLQHQGRVAEALEAYRRAVVLDAKNADVVFGLATAVEAGGDVAEAVGLYFNVLSLAPKRARVAKRLEASILKLSETDAKLARDFATGWVKNFPESKTAQRVLEKVRH